MQLSSLIQANPDTQKSALVTIEGEFCICPIGPSGFELGIERICEIHSRGAPSVGRVMESVHSLNSYHLLPLLPSPLPLLLLLRPLLASLSLLATAAAATPPPAALAVTAVPLLKEGGGGGQLGGQGGQGITNLGHISIEQSLFNSVSCRMNVVVQIELPRVASVGLWE